MFVGVLGRGKGGGEKEGRKEGRREEEEREEGEGRGLNIAFVRSGEVQTFIHLF